jgi:general L-amino acid transport system substrate-binding protein
MAGKALVPALALALGLLATQAQAQTLEAVRARGHLLCGVQDGIPGFSARDNAGNWAGLDVDYCRALAAAIFDDPAKVDYPPVSPSQRVENLANGALDVLMRARWSMTRDTEQGVGLVGALFYDGQGFVSRADGVASALELDGKTVCVEAGAAAALNLADYAGANGLDIEVEALPSHEEVVSAYLEGRCSAYTANASAIAAERTRFPDPSAHRILPEIISKEPLGPLVRSGDADWFTITRWTYFALLDAEELGVTHANVDDMLGSENPEIRRLLGVEGNFGEPMGLTADWAYRIVKHVGNYGELFDREVGPATPLALERGLNALWTDGGIQYAPPIR